MSVVAARAPSQVVEPAEPKGERARAERRPGWPLAVLFVGFPIWWLLGLSQVICLVIAVVMAVELLHHRRILVPSAFGVWLVFLLWTLTGPLVAQVGAPGTVATVQLSRYFTWLYHFSFLAVGTVALVYIRTLRLSAARLGRLLSAMFVVVVAGGLLGVLAPHLSFPSLVELVLPRHLDANTFVRAQVHPTPAELQDYLGDKHARPSAPYAYSNSWGLSYALLVPFFVTSWLAKDAGWRRYAGPVVLAISVIPVVFSLNRGLWAVLILTMLFVALRGVITGRLWILAGVLAVVALIASTLYLTSLGATIEKRLSGHNSNEGRTNLSSLAVSGAAERSPVVGFGTTRRVQGSFNSIAQGSTPQCRLCSPPALGTQGQLWTVTFSFGLVGAALFLAFFCYHFFRRLASRSAADTTALTVLLVYLATLPIYDFNYPGMIAVMAAVSILDRSGRNARTRTLAQVTAPLREHWRILVAGAVLGAVAGAATQLLVTPTYRSTASVEVPLGTLAPGQHTEQVTLDDVAQEAKGTAVTSAVALALDVPASEAADHLTVTATPTTRILHLTYDAATASSAQAGAQAAADALLATRSRDLAAERRRQVRIYGDELASTSRALVTLRQSRPPGSAWESLSATTGGPVPSQLQRAEDDLTRAVTMDVRPGWHFATSPAKRQLDGWTIWTTSGAALGALLGMVLAVFVAPRRRRLGMLGPHEDVVAGTPVVLHLDVGTALKADMSGKAQRTLEGRNADAYLAVDGERLPEHVAHFLNHHAHRPAHPDRQRAVILVGTTRTRQARVEAEVRRLRASAIGVAGVALVSRSRLDHDRSVDPTHTHEKEAR